MAQMVRILAGDKNTSYFNQLGTVQQKYLAGIYDEEEVYMVNYTPNQLRAVLAPLFKSRLGIFKKSELEFIKKGKLRGKNSHQSKG